MFYFDATLAADAVITLPVETMVCTPTFYDAGMAVVLFAETMDCAPTFNAAEMVAVLPVDTMAINVVFNDVRLVGPGGQPFLGGSVGFSIARSIPTAIDQDFS
jgi:hypothetical protein